MAGAVIEFLRRFFDGARVDVDQLTVELNNAGLSETSYSELEEGLTLLADELTAERQALIDASRAQLASAVAGEPAAAREMTIGELQLRLGSIGVVPVEPVGDVTASGDGPPGATVVTDAAAPAEVIESDGSGQSLGDMPPGVETTSPAPVAPSSSPAPTESGSSSGSSGSGTTDSDTGGGAAPGGSHGSGPGGHQPPPGGDHQPPPTNGEAPDEYQPPYDNGDENDDRVDPAEAQNGVGPAEWGGYETSYADGDYYVRIDGVQLQLVPDGQGGYYADHGEYRLAEAEAGLAWIDPPSIESYAVHEITATGIVILPLALDPGVKVYIEPNEVRWEVDSGSGASSITFGDQWEFGGIESGDLSMIHADGWYYVIAPDGTGSYHDPDTGESYDSYGDLQDALENAENAEVDPGDTYDETEDADTDGPVGEIDTIDPLPAEWSGYELESDGNGYYVLIDGVQLPLTRDGNGGYFAQHHGYRLDESAEGPVWNESPTGVTYVVSEVTADGFAVAHPNGGTVGFRDGGFDYSHGGNHVTFADPYEFYEMSADGVVASAYAIHEDMHLEYAGGTYTYIDTDTGLRYDSQAEYNAAQEHEESATAETPADDREDVGAEVFEQAEPVADTNGDDTNGDDPSDTDAGSDDLAPPPPDAIGIDYAGGQPVLSIVYGGVPYQVPLTASNGAYYVELGGRQHEVYSEGGTYFVVADGTAYDLNGNPNDSGWPYDHPASGVDASRYDEVPEAETAPSDSPPAPHANDRPPMNETDQMSDESSPDDPPEDGYTFYGRYTDDDGAGEGSAMGADGSHDMGAGGTDTTGSDGSGMGVDMTPPQEQPPLEDSLPPEDPAIAGVDESMLDADPAEEATE